MLQEKGRMGPEGPPDPALGHCGEEPWGAGSSPQLTVYKPARDDYGLG